MTVLEKALIAVSIAEAIAIVYLWLLGGFGIRFGRHKEEEE